MTNTYQPPRPGEQQQQHGQGPAASARATNASAYSAHASSAASDEQFAHLPVIQRSIIKFIIKQNEAGKTDGVHVAAIARAVGGEASAIRYENPLSMHCIGMHSRLSPSSDALDKLMDDGQVYTTIDESHFNVSV